MITIHIDYTNKDSVVKVSSPTTRELDSMLNAVCQIIHNIQKASNGKIRKTDIFKRMRQRKPPQATGEQTEKTKST